MATGHASGYTLPAGVDNLTLEGSANAFAAGNTGNNNIITGNAGADTLITGNGRDVFEFLAGAHATITDFQAAQDGIVLHGLTASQIMVTDSGGNTYIALGNNSQIALAGVSLTANQIHITYA